MSEQIFLVTVAAVQDRKPFRFWRVAMKIEGESDIASLEKALVEKHAQSHNALAATIYQLREPRVLLVNDARLEFSNLQSLLGKANELPSDVIIQDVLLTTQTLVVLLECVAPHVPVSPTAGEIVGQLQRESGESVATPHIAAPPNPQSLLVLNCWVLGDSHNNIFSVEIFRTELVISLKEAIKKKKDPVFKDISADQLVLWHVSEVADQNLGNNLDNANFPGKELLSSVDELSKIFPNSPVRVCLHIVVGCPDDEDLPRPRKRARTSRNDEEDYFQFLERLRNKHKLSQTELPSIAGLRSFLNTPLEESEKITISQQLFDGFLSERLDDRCTEKDVSALFKVGIVGPASLPFVNVIGPPDPSRTKAGYHYYWDLNLRQILRALIPEGEAIRNTNYHTETRNVRPNFGYLIAQRCVFLGEERRPTSPGDSAIELTQKIVWAHDSAPYILGYYADMTRITFVALEHLDGRIQRTDLETIDLKRTVDRIFNLRRLINMSFILRRLASMVLEPTPEFLLREGPNCTISFVSGKYVVKTYTCSDRIARVKHLKTIYALLQEAHVPNTDSLVSVKDSVAFLEPVGLDTPPNTIGQLRECVLCILDTLEKAHKIPLYHRDIRKENVIRSLEDPSKWFLIDWEDASTKPTFALPNFKRETHSPTVLEDDHGPEVDIWGVGYLIKTADGVIPAEIRELGDRICHDSRNLTALETRELVNSVFSGYM